jgi:hypothetical protein
MESKELGDKATLIYVQLSQELGRDIVSEQAKIIK